MNACDGRLAHNIRQQEITEKMRAVFRPLLIVAQTLHHLCRATAVALHWCRIFRLMFSIAVSHENRATPLKVSQKRPFRTLFWGGGGAVAP